MKISGISTFIGRQRLLFLILILTVVVLFATGVTNHFLFNATLKQYRVRLLISAQSQARLMESVARFDSQYSTDYPGGAIAATISQIEEAYESFNLFGGTEEFTIARREGDQIVFLFRQGPHGQNTPMRVSFDSELAEPMREALLGQSGTMIGLDWLGVSVLAAFEPVKVLNLGVVVKIDLTEIRAPFIKSGIITGVVALAAIIAGAFLFVRTTNPMIRRVQESEAKYRDLVETSQDLIWRNDREGRFTYLNPAWESTLGYSLEEMIGHEFPDFKRPGEREQNFQRHHRTMQGDSETNYESTYISKTGEDVILNFKVKPLFDASGQVVGAQGTATDITERKHAEEELRVKEEKYRNLFEYANDSIFISEPSTEYFLDVNENAARRLGYTKEELLQKMIYEIGRSKDNNSYAGIIKELKETGHIVFETVHVHKDGTEMPVEISSRLIDVGGRNVFQSFVRDITERKGAEEALRKVNQHLELSIEHMPIGYIVWNQEFTVGEWNPAAEAIFGYSRKEILGKSPLETIVPDDARPFVAEAIAKLLKGEEASYSSSQNNIRKDGEVISCQWFNAPLADSTGKPNGVLSMVIDVTEQERAERKLRESEEKYRTLIEASHQGILVHKNYKFLFTNEALADILGFKTVEELCKTDLRELYLPEDRHLVEAKHESIITGSIRPEYFERRLLRKDGQQIWAKLMAIKVDWGGEPAVLAIIEDITEGKRSENELRKSEEKYRDLVETSQDLIWRSDIEGHFIYLNPAWESTLGYKQEEMLGQIFSNFKDPETLAQDKFTREHVLSGGSLNDYETTFLSKSGEKVQLSFKAKALINSTGQIIGTQGTAFDITSRKRAELALQESEERFRVAVETAYDAIISGDEEGKIIFWNKSATRIFGYKKEEMINENIIKLIPTSLQAQHNEAFKRACAGKKLRLHGKINKVVGLTKDGTEIPIEISIARWKVGNRNYFTAIIRDILDRLKIENNLRESEKRTREFIDSAPALLGYVDKNFHYQQLNKSFLKFYGLTEKEAIGKSIIEMVGPEGFEQLHPYLEEVLEGREINFDVKRSIRDLGIRDLNINYVPDVDERGEVIGFYFCTLDITERKQLEAQFQHSQKMEAVGTLAGGIAHDFNNMLQIITGFGQLALRSLQDNKKRDVGNDLERILQASESAAKLTRQLLAYSRREILTPRKMDINDLIANQMKMVRRLIGESIELEINCKNESMPVFADAGRLEQVFMNICVNARDAMANGGKLIIEIEIFTADEKFCTESSWAKPQDYILISFSDTGTGITLENRAHIFDPFFTTKDQGEGTGLGLSTAYGIIKQHNGMIDVISEVGEGTTFKVYLPKVEIIKNESKKSVEDPVYSGHETILFAEDEDGVRDYVVDLLESNGYTVIAVQDGHEALECFKKRNHAIDLVILDMVMPKLSGRRVFEHIQNIRSDVPVLFSTGYTSDIIDVEFLQEQNIRLIQKPFSPNDLLKEVRETLKMV